MPTHPARPDRVCWGCNKCCPADDLACGNGTIRTLHPIELFGDDWVEYFNPTPSTPEEPQTIISPVNPRRP